MAFVMSAIRGVVIGFAWWAGQALAQYIFPDTAPAVAPWVIAVAVTAALPWSCGQARREWEIYRDLYR